MLQLTMLNWMESSLTNLAKIEDNLLEDYYTLFDHSTLRNSYSLRYLIESWRMFYNIDRFENATMTR